MKKRLNTPYEFISKILLIVFAFLSISFVFGYYWLLLKNHSLNTSNLIVKTIEAYNSFPGCDNSVKEMVFRNITEIIADAERPFIILNEKDDPVIWAHLPVEKDPVASIKIIKSQNITPVIFKNEIGERRLYYIPDDLIEKVKFYPFFLLGSILLTIFITGYLYMFMRRNEKQSIWIAMSKETAHQLGTPLTSLKGWRDYLFELSKENDTLNEVEEGLREDVERIEIIADRFSKIASDKELKMSDMKSILEKSADYISKRVSVDPERISIIKQLEQVPDIYANPVLIEWTVENILKNSIESLKADGKGEIILKMFEEKNKIIIEIHDNGSGINPSIRKNVFETGFTTKKRGWGLGLSLAKKVIEQYHNGNIFIKETSHNGTVFRIELNKFI